MHIYHFLSFHPPTVLVRNVLQVYAYKVVRELLQQFTKVPAVCALLRRSNRIFNTANAKMLLYTV